MTLRWISLNFMQLHAPFNPGSPSLYLIFLIFMDLPLNVAKISRWRKKLQPSKVNTLDEEAAILSSKIYSLVSKRYIYLLYITIK